MKRIRVEHRPVDGLEARLESSRRRNAKLLLQLHYQQQSRWPLSLCFEGGKLVTCTCNRAPGTFLVHRRNQAEHRRDPLARYTAVKRHMIRAVSFPVVGFS